VWPASSRKTIDPGNLTIPLGVSAWIVRSDVDLAQACDAMLELRGAFLSVSGLDLRSEPVPLVAVTGGPQFSLGRLPRRSHGPGLPAWPGPRARKLAEAALALLNFVSLSAMCRSIQTLRGPEPTSDEQVNAAALQYVRKISGYRAPSEANRATFERAVSEVARATQALLDGLVTRAPSPRQV